MAFTIGKVTTKERLHELVDKLSETEANAALGLIASWYERESKPGDIVDEWGNLSAMRRADSARRQSRLDEEERAELGESIADALRYKGPK